MSWRKYFVLALIVLFGSFGNVLMARGMKAVGELHLSQWTHAITALFNPTVALATIFLIIFMACYMTALSWADLTFVLPATSFGYILVALLGQYLLGEHITAMRWLGIALVTGGVGFVAGGRPHTPKHERHEIAQARAEQQERG